MSAPKRRKMQINIELPADLDATYTNFALITHTPSEIIIDFAQVLPNTPKGKIHARIVTTPMNAKRLLRALSENLDKYEAQYGEIKLPEGEEGLASQLFGHVKPPQAPST